MRSIITVMNLRFAAGALTAVLALALSPTATADPANELAYISSLNAFGATVFNAQQAIETGYWVCDQLQYTSGDDVARKLYLSTDAQSMKHAQVIVVAAAMNLCPWQYHPERLNGDELTHLQ